MDMPFGGHVYNINVVGARHLTSTWWARANVLGGHHCHGMMDIAECLGKYPELHRRLININFNHVLFFPRFIWCISDDSSLGMILAWEFRVHF